MGQVRKRVLGSLAMAALLVLSGVGGCGGQEREEEHVDRQAEALEGGGDAEGGACRSVALVASKTYGPSQWADANESPSPELRFALPSVVPVTAGNAGNHWITFTYARAAAPPVSCRYNGGASQAHPNSPAQIALGLKYVFLSCSNGAAAGSTIIADHLTLHVDNGDSYKSPTTVRMTLSELDPCSVADGGSDAASSDAATDSGSSCTPASCDDHVSCTLDTCGSSGCTHTPVSAGTACSTGPCTTGDACNASGTCVPGAPIAVDDGNPCTADRCDPVLGVQHTPAAPGAACDNATVCDGRETCNAAATCVAGTPPVIDDGNPCTADACDPITGVHHTPRAAGDPACSDNNACNGLETCNGAGACVSGAPPVIDDGNACTIDGCNPATGPTHTPIASCDPTPTQGAAPFEARASILGRLITRSGGAVTGATFTVTEAPPPDGSGVVRSDVAASAASDGSFRLRLTNFRDVEVEGTPPLHVLLRVDAPGVLPVFRDAWLHTGAAADLGIVKMVPRDPASTPIGPAGGTASDSANRIQVVIPAGALSATINVVITPFNTRDELPAPLPDATVTMYGFELEPSGTTFSAPVTVRIANTKSFPTTISIPTGFFDSAVGRWEHLGQATWDGARFSFTTTHFTPMDANAKKGNDPGVAGGPGPPPAPPPLGPCGGGCCPPPPPGAPPPPPDPGSGPSPLEGIGSRAAMTGGALSQTFRLPTYRVRNEDFGITLGYDSGLAGGRSQGAAPNDYQAVGHAAHAVSVRGLRLTAVSVPAATALGGDRVSPIPRRPGLCGAQGSTSFGQPGGIPLRADFSWAGATTTQSFSMGASSRQADFAGFLNLPIQGSQVPGPGLYPTRVVVNAQSPGACVSSGGTFGVSDEQSAGTQLAVEPGPLATFDYHELVNHRLSSPYGAGWTVKELERVYRAGDVAFLVNGDGADERFRPRAYPTPITELIGPFRIARDPQTGEIFLVQDSGVIARIDPITGARTTIMAGLALSSGVRGAAVAYVGAARHFAIALTNGLVDVDASGTLTVLATRAAPPQFRDASVAARGDLVFYTDAVSATLYRTRLSDAAHAVDAISLATGGDVRFYPRVSLSGVTFADPRGMDFGADGTLYLADVQRNAVYALSPQTNGEVGPTSAAAPAIGDGSSSFFAPLGERAPGVKLAIREPLAVSAAEDGSLLVVTAYGAAWYDPLAREAEWLTFWAGVDEISLNPTRLTANALALGQSSFLLRTDVSASMVVRMDVDRLSSEFEPTRTLKKLTGGGLELVDTTQAMIEDFDSAGRITARKRRTGELMMGFAYADAQSDKLARVTDPVGGETAFTYDGAGKLQRITDPRGRVTNVTVTDLGDLTTFSEPDLETYHFVYAEHRMTQKQSPRGDLTSYAFRADGTLQTSTKPEGQVTTVDAVLSHAPT